MPSLQGHFLVASSQLGDPNFMRTVILMVQHDENGALGLVLNRATTVTVSQACNDSLNVPCVIEDQLFQGGPVEGPLMALHGYEHFGQIEIVPGLFFSTERDKLEWLLTNADEPTRWFVGYSGWSAGQLESELEEGAWVTTAAEKDVIYHDAERLWNWLMTKLTLGQWIDPKEIPEDPTVN